MRLRPGTPAVAVAVAVGFLGLFPYLPVRLSEEGMKGERMSLGAGLSWSFWAVGITFVTGPFIPFLLVHLLRYGLFVSLGKPAEYVVPADRFVDPAELGYEARGRLRRIQDACDRVVEAQRLIPDFDAWPALVVLLEQEWLVARDLARIAPLAEEVGRLAAEAASDRVREAIRPREKVVKAANRQVNRRLGRVAKYMRPVDAALTAHREWEQLSHLAGGTEDYADLLARGGSGPAGPLPHDLHGDRALRASRAAIEGHVREAHEAAAWLTSAVRENG
ncbi:hypothetical protein KIK06_08225 [Nocardiopsis sp. EMB25]|uniref:hypothetical protein n=1 Tax=Nocardiopsis sp. EMB25 TaxID=2835867 RepID=UPI0022840C43|nr:hypothetical protein [Nocardiopsis sp. EMB25]MCY9783876.1 hypothetical protein [Nocardiopsis sp. EMB25]